MNQAIKFTIVSLVTLGVACGNCPDSIYRLVQGESGEMELLVDLKDMPELWQHTLLKDRPVPVAPGALYVSLAALFGQMTAGKDIVHLTGVSVPSPLFLGDTVGASIPIFVRTAAKGRRVLTHVESTSAKHLRSNAVEPADAVPVDDLAKREVSAFAKAVDPQVLYGNDQVFQKIGIQYGEDFSSLTNLKVDGLFATADLTSALSAEGHSIHPALFDMAMHPIAAIFFEASGEKMDRRPAVPVGFDQVWVNKSVTGTLKTKVAVTGSLDGDFVSFDMWIGNAQGETAVLVKGGRLMRVTPSQMGF